MHIYPSMYDAVQRALEATIALWCAKQDIERLLGTAMDGSYFEILDEVLADCPQITDHTITEAISRLGTCTQSQADSTTLNSHRVVDEKECAASAYIADQPQKGLHDAAT